MKKLIECVVEEHEAAVEMSHRLILFLVRCVGSIRQAVRDRLRGGAGK